MPHSFSLRLVGVSSLLQVNPVYPWKGPHIFLWALQSVWPRLKYLPQNELQKPKDLECVCPSQTLGQTYTANLQSLWEGCCCYGLMTSSPWSACAASIQLLYAAATTVSWSMTQYVSNGWCVHAVCCCSLMCLISCLTTSATSFRC